MLASLIRREIEVDVEQRSQITAAVLLGGNIQVPADRPVVGRSGRHLPVPPGLRARFGQHTGADEVRRALLQLPPTRR